MSQQSYLDTTLLSFSDTEHWTIRDAVRGCQIFGSIGSGKTSGSGQFIAKKYLKAGFGGLVLCAKPEEAADWIEYAKSCGKTDDDIIHFCEGSKYRFNPLQYETARKSKGGGLTFNLTELFMSVFKMGQRISGSDSEEQERFWENSLKRLINRTIDLIKLSGEEMSVYNMVEIIGTMPTNTDTLLEIREKGKSLDGIKVLNESNFCFKCMAYALNNITNPKEERDCNLVYNYFYRDFPLLDDKAQSTIKEMFLGFAEPFLTGILNDHFAEGTNVTPENTFDGKIIILDFSVKEYLVAGIYAQCLFKYLWQQSVERRNIEDDTKPVFLWIDESQYFINEYDVIFQTTARSSRACTVLLSQNISNYYMQMGGKNVKAKVDSLLGNLGTLIFHNNSDAVTNEWASRLIGQEIAHMPQLNISSKLYSTDLQTSETTVASYMPQVQPKRFTTLRSGGSDNNYQVDAIVFVTGKSWADGKNYRKTFFTQNKNSSK